MPTTPDSLRVIFATKYILSGFATEMVDFSGGFIGQQGDAMMARCWETFCGRNLPAGAPVPPNEIKTICAREGDRILIGVEFSSPRVAGEPYFGVALLGPVPNDAWSAAGRSSAPFRYFVLFRGPTGTSVEEWTSDPPTVFGTGPDPELFGFVDWVLNCVLGKTITRTVATDNADMLQAIEKARQTLPAVLARLAAGEMEEANFTVKFPVSDGEGTEYFWLSETTFADGCFSGVIDDEAQCVSTIKRGDRRTVPVAEVIDWSYVQNQMMYGNFTLRALLPTMPPSRGCKVSSSHGGVAGVAGVRADVQAPMVQPLALRAV